MVDANVIEAVNYFAENIRKKGVRISRIIVFGSSSTGWRSPDSDIDIAVISDDFAGKDLFDRTLLTKDAELNTIRKFKVPLDVITLSSEEFSEEDSILSKNIKKGVTISAASSA
jgi:predicted nucleotidyltransferase